MPEIEGIFRKTSCKTKSTKQHSQLSERFLCETYHR